MSEQYRPERLHWLPIRKELWEEWERLAGKPLDQAEVIALLNMIFHGRLKVSKP